MMRKQFLFFSLLLITAWPLGVGASSFSVSPAKTELNLKPGSKAEQTIVLVNNSSEETKFDVGLRDLAPADRPDEVLKLLGDELGPYSLKPYLDLTELSFSLPAGASKKILIKVNVPENAPPGGRFGAITFSTKPKDGSGAKFSAQIASLLFLRIPGEAVVGGRLTSFQTSGSRITIGRAPKFLFSFENTGNVYLNPYGGLDLKPRISLFGTSTPVFPNFVLPGSTRIREINFEKHWYLAGWYQAELNLNRGYANQVDQKKIQVIILPWWLIGFLAAFLLVLVIYLVIKLKHWRNL